MTGFKLRRSMLGAIDLLIPRAAGQQEWLYPEIGSLRYAASDIIHAAADEGFENAIAAVDELEAPPVEDLRYVKPAVEQLDNIAVVG